MLFSWGCTQPCTCEQSPSAAASHTYRGNERQKAIGPGDAHVRPLLHFRVVFGIVPPGKREECISLWKVRISARQAMAHGRADVQLGLFKARPKTV